MTHWPDEDDDDSDDAALRGDDADHALSGAEDPDPSDLDGPADDDDVTVPCPFCARAVYESADVCPKCGNFIGGSDDPSRSPRRAWVVVVIVVCLVAVLIVYGARAW